MIKSKEMIPQTIIEVTTPFFLIDGDPGTGFLDNNIKKIDVNIGEQYEIIKCSKKNGALVLEMKQTTQPYKHGKQWVIYCNKFLKIISKPEITNSLFKENEAQLNNDEEFVIVNKVDPELYLLTVKYFWAEYSLKRDYSECIIENDLVFTKKKGQRKRLKDLQSLHGFLLNLTSLSNDFFFEQDPSILYNLHPLFNTPRWTHNVSNKIDLETIKNLELRKYNTTTKKVSTQVVNFDIYKVVLNKIKKFNLTKNYGEAVSHVLSTLNEENKISDYPFLVSIKYTEDFLKENFYEYNRACFTKKDTDFEQTIKNLKIKKSDNMYYQNNSFACIAFKSESEAILFKDSYINNDREVEILKTNELLNKMES